MALRVKASDVLDPNAVVCQRFRAKVLGHFRRAGPNRWDDYLLVEDDQGEVDVMPGARVQLESQGTELRIRSRGRVLRVRAIQSAVSELTPAERRDRFVAEYLDSFDESPGLGAAAFVAKTLIR